jgi:MFS family permease
MPLGNLINKVLMIVKILKDLPKLVLVFIAWNTLRVFPFNFFWIIRAYYLLHMGMNALSIATIQIIAPIFEAFFLIPCGLIVNKFGWKKFMLIGTILDGFSLSIYGLFSDFTLFVLASMMEGLANALITPSSTPMLSILAGQEKATRAYSLSSSIESFVSVPATFMSTIPAIVSMSLGYDIKLIERLMFFFGVIPIIIAALFVLPLPNVKRDLPRYSIPKTHRLMAVKFSVYQALMGLGAGFIGPLIPIWLFYRFNTSEFFSSLIFGINAIAIGFAFLIAPRLETKMGVRWSIVGTQLLGVFLLFIIPIVNEVYTVSLIFITRFVLMNLTTPIQISFMMRAIPDELKPVISSVATPQFGLTWLLPWVGSQLLGGYLINVGEMNLSFFIASFSYILGIFLFWYFFRKPERVKDQNGGSKVRFRRS